MVRLHKKSAAEIAVENDVAEKESAKRVKKSKKIAEKPAHESDANDDKVYFVALGGLEHIGQNMYVYKYKGTQDPLMITCINTKENIWSWIVVWVSWKKKSVQAMFNTVIQHG